MIDDDLRDRYLALRAEMRAKYDRDLPFEELIFDRWERARHLGFGEGASIYHSAYVFGDVKVGERTWIGPNVMLDGSGGLEIGAWCSIATGVQLYSHDTVDWALTGGEAEPARSRTVIGDRVYIGAGAVVGKGVTIGTGTIIGALAFVNADVPAGLIAGGVPARILGRVDGTTRIYVPEDAGMEVPRARVSASGPRPAKTT